MLPLRRRLGPPSGRGAPLIAQLGPLEFLVAGFDASVSFRLAAADAAKNRQMEPVTRILHHTLPLYDEPIYLHSN